MWMDGNRLKMNESKTKFIQFGSRQQLNKCYTQHLAVNDCPISKVTDIKYLGACLDQNLSIKLHIKQKCRAATANYQRISIIRKYLTVSACKQIVHGLITSHIDYCNSLCYGLPKCEIKKLQRVQNMAAKLVLGKGKIDSPTVCLKELHWLPVALRIEFKILTLVWKCLNNEAPAYLIDLLHTNTTERTLRSNTKKQLIIPKSKCKTFGERSFAVSGPRLWNQLASDIQHAKSIDQFKAKLKTLMFSKF